MTITILLRSKNLLSQIYFNQGFMHEKNMHKQLYNIESHISLIKLVRCPNYLGEQTCNLK